MVQLTNEDKEWSKFVHQVIEATLEHTPEEKHEDMSGETYSFKNRWLRGRMIPSSFIHADMEGGYEVKSQRRGDKTMYSVFKTCFGKWICTCYDFSMHHRPCKHGIKVALYVNQMPDEKTKQAKMIEKMIYTLGQPEPVEFKRADEIT